MCAGVHLLQFLNALTFSTITLFSSASNCIIYCPTSLQETMLCYIIIWTRYVQRKQTFDNFMISLLDKTENSL